MRSRADLAGLIDLERYPIAAPTSPAGAALLADCRGQLERTGACVLPGFLRPDVIAATAAEGTRLAPLAHRTANSRSTCYLAPPDDSFPAGHPKSRLQTTSVGAVAY